MRMTSSSCRWLIACWKSTLVTSDCSTLASAASIVKRRLQQHT